jgi:hypothetical protein
MSEDPVLPTEEQDYEDDTIPMSPDALYEVKLQAQFTAAGRAQWVTVTAADSMMPLVDDEGNAAGWEGAESQQWRVTETAHRALAMNVARRKYDEAELQRAAIAAMTHPTTAQEG